MEGNTERYWVIRDADTSIMFHDIASDHWEEWRVVREVNEDDDYDEVEEDDDVVLSPKFTWIEYQGSIIEFSRIVTKVERRMILRECVDLLSRRKIVPETYFTVECNYYNRLKNYLKRIGDQYSDTAMMFMERTREDWKTLW